jgi:hypothetical protein
VCPTLCLTSPVGVVLRLWCWFDQIRCEEEDVVMTDDALELLTKIGIETSLR